MSRVFDALTKGQGEVASFLLPLVSRAGTSKDAESRGALDVSPTPLHARHTISDTHEPAVEEVRLGRVENVVLYTDPTGPAADRFRLLRVHLSELWTAGKLKSILITSALAGDGKTTVALNLATVLVEERRRKVLLIDADLRRMALNEQLGLRPCSGLSECLRRGVDPLTFIRRVEPFGWYLLPSGTADAKSQTEVLPPEDIATMFQRLYTQFDWIIVDSPPVLPVSDALALRQHVDGTVLVAKAERTPAKAVEDAIALIGRHHVTALVLNGVENLEAEYV